MNSNMKRIERKEFAYHLPKKGGVTDLLDGFFQLLFRLDQEKTDLILNSLTDNEIQYLNTELKTIQAKKEFLNWLEKKIENKGIQL